jgi:hypothetical protein
MEDQMHEERFGTEWDIPWDFHPNLLPILHHFNDNLNLTKTLIEPASNKEMPMQLNHVP